MLSIRSLASRSAGMMMARRSLTDGSSDSIITGMIVLLSLVFLALLLVAVLVLIRRMRAQQAQRSRQPVLPSYHDSTAEGGNKNHRRLTIQTQDGRQSVLVLSRDGQPMLSNPRSPPHSPENVPEIHITFPDDDENDGRAAGRGGRVVLVRVGENASVGMEPLHYDEQLPAYEKESKSGFYDVDIEKIGGLKEKDRSDFH